MKVKVEVYNENMNSSMYDSVTNNETGDYSVSPKSEMD